MDTINNKISLNEIFDYSFYDDNGHYIVKLNAAKLKTLFQADDVIFEEVEHK